MLQSCLYGNTSNAERKEARTERLDEEKSSTGLENKEKCRNAAELTRGQVLHVVPCDSK